MKRLAAVVFLLTALAGCKTPSPTSVCSFDTDRSVAGLDLAPSAPASFVAYLQGCQAAWRRDPAFAELNDRLRQPDVKAVIGLQIGCAPGGGYKSVWFIQGRNGAEEVSTGPAPGRFRRRVMPDREWATLKAKWRQATGEAVGSLINPAVLDGAVYFVCAAVDGRRTAFVVYDMAARNRQFAVLFDLLSSSEFQEVPIDVRREMGTP